MTDVGTTKRKPLTPTQRLKLFEAHKGLCGICGAQIRAGDLWIDEHIIPLGLGGSNDMENRAPVHVQCAHSKTHGSQGDVAKIAKAKRQKMKSLGIERQKVKIKSRGFLTSRKEPRIEKAVLPPRNIYE
jgi:5-methylcytosine-specific restriction endonuclease McrA